MIKMKGREEMYTAIYDIVLNTQRQKTIKILTYNTVII